MSIQDFEKRPGVNRVEVRHGHAQAHVFSLPAPVMDERLRVLKAVADANVSIDFLKLTEDGLSFIMGDADKGAVSAALKELGVRFSILESVSVVLVHAVNMRDEEGLIAGIVRQAISSGARVSHIGDMHDRLLLVVESKDADKLAAQFRRTFLEASA